MDVLENREFLMKKTVSHSFSLKRYLFLLFTLTTAPLQAGQVTDPAYTSAAANFSISSRTDRLIIKFRQSTNKNKLPAQMANMAYMLESLSGATSTHVRKTFSGAQIVQLNQKISIADIQAITDQIEQDETIEYVEPDLIMHPLLTPNDPMYSEQWHYYQGTGGINLPGAWDISQGNNTVVAVIDSGFQPHSDLNPNLLPGYDMISDEFIANDGDGRDSDPTDEGDYAPMSQVQWRR
jgi:serine protease